MTAISDNCINFISYKTLKQTKDKTKKKKNENESLFKWINITIADLILRGIIIGFYVTHRFTEVYLPQNQ